MGPMLFRVGFNIIWRKSLWISSETSNALSTYLLLITLIMRPTNIIYIRGRAVVVTSLGFIILGIRSFFIHDSGYLPNPAVSSLYWLWLWLDWIMGSNTWPKRSKVKKGVWSRRITIFRSWFLGTLHRIYVTLMRVSLCSPLLFITGLRRDHS